MKATIINREPGERKFTIIENNETVQEKLLSLAADASVLYEAEAHTTTHPPYVSFTEVNLDEVLDPTLDLGEATVALRKFLKPFSHADKHRILNASLILAGANSV